LIKDYYEKPQLFLEVKLKRDIYNQGMLAVRYFVLFSTIAGFVLLVITSILLERVVIKKIIKFNSNISEITKKNDFSKRITVVGKDEFSNMSANVNIMLEALEGASYETETEHQKSEAYLSVMGTMLVALDLDGNVDFINERAMEILGIGAHEDVTGENWFESFIPKKDQEDVKTVFKEISKDDGKNNYHENLVLARKGEEKLIAWHNVILKDGVGKIIGIVSSGDDITEKRKQEEKEKKLSTELKEMNALMIGRELKMAELKKENEKLRKDQF
jgi:PAS domain S-box-containing protein